MSFSEIKPPDRAANKPLVKFGIRVTSSGRVFGRIVLSPAFCKEHQITAETRFRVLAGHANERGKVRLAIDGGGPFKSAFLRGAAIVWLGTLPGMSSININSKPCEIEETSDKGTFLITLPRFLFFDEGEDADTEDADTEDADTEDADTEDGGPPSGALARGRKNSGEPHALSGNQAALLKAIQLLHGESVDDMTWGMLVQKSGVPKGSLGSTLQALIDKNFIRRQATMAGVIYETVGKA